jgi:hypothetical protein
MVSERQRTVNELIDAIVLNSSGVYTKKELVGKTKDELQKLSNLLARTNVPVVNSSHTNIQLSSEILNSNATLDVPSTFPANS